MPFLQLSQTHCRMVWNIGNNIREKDMFSL